jgi:hypothetical protein
MKFYVAVRWWDHDPQWEGQPRTVGFWLSAEPNHTTREGDADSREVLYDEVARIAQAASLFVDDGLDLEGAELSAIMPIVESVAGVYIKARHPAGRLWSRIHEGLRGGGIMRITRKA